MKRRIIKIGNSSMAVTLPSTWIAAHKIKPGDELEVSGTDLLTIGIAAIPREHRVLVMKQMSYYLLSRHLTIFYRSNCSRVTLNVEQDGVRNIKTRKVEPVSTVVNRILGRFIGAEIVSQTETAIEIEFFGVEDAQSMEMIARRINFLFKQLFEEIIAAMDDDFAEFAKTRYLRHDTIAKFINFYLRRLDASHWPHEQKLAAYTAYVSLDSAADAARHISEAIVEYGATEPVKRCLKLIFAHFVDMLALLTGRKLDDALVEARYALLQKIYAEKLTVSELRVLDFAMRLFGVFNAFSEFSIVRKNTC